MLMTDKPIVALSCDLDEDLRIRLRQDYVEPFAEAGAVVVIVPPFTSADDLEEWLRAVGASGVVFSGGPDMHPSYFGEEPHPAIGRISLQRDVYELALYEAAGRLHLPVAAICRGLQLVNVACGGTLVQDMPSQLGEAFALHDQTFPGDKPAHPVTLEPDSAVARLFGTEHLSANSFHHQCVKELGQGLRLAGVSSDGVVEALESFDGRVVAVQFHPERMTKTYPEMHRCFTRWVAGLREKPLRH